MKVSIDGILGSAQKINNQRELNEESLNKQKKEVKTDSVAIGTRVNSRLDTIESELRDIQSTMTGNQVVRNGVEQLRDDLDQGGENQKNILEDVRINGQPVLEEFMGGTINETTINSRMEDVDTLINNDVSKLKTLQVEVDNIMASNLAGDDKVGNLMGNINNAFADTGAGGLDNISNLRPDSVMRLIK
ncbi:MAG: hypothetical protein GY754_27780 [bacterium]|nr:hypothetical protein [bacterium]